MASLALLILVAVFLFTETSWGFWAAVASLLGVVAVNLWPIEVLARCVT